MKRLSGEQARQLIKKWVLEENDTELSDESDESSDVDDDGGTKGIFGKFISASMYS